MFNWILPVNSRFDQSWHTCSVVVELWWERGERWTGNMERTGSAAAIRMPQKNRRREKGGEGYWHDITTNKNCPVAL
jgi:hypothetical protein